jgi:hypothetical protein
LLPCSAMHGLTKSTRSTTAVAGCKTYRGGCDRGEHGLPLKAQRSEYRSDSHKRRGVFCGISQGGGVFEGGVFLVLVFCLWGGGCFCKGGCFWWGALRVTGTWKQGGRRGVLAP